MPEPSTLNFFSPRFRAARIDDFLEALIMLHRQFEWSYPVAPNGSRVSSTSRDSSKICKLDYFNPICRNTMTENLLSARYFKVSTLFAAYLKLAFAKLLHPLIRKILFSTMVNWTKNPSFEIFSTTKTHTLALAAKE